MERGYDGHRLQTVRWLLQSCSATSPHSWVQGCVLLRTTRMTDDLKERVKSLGETLTAFARLGAILRLETRRSTLGSDRDRVAFTSKARGSLWRLQPPGYLRWSTLTDDFVRTDRERNKCRQRVAAVYLLNGPHQRSSFEVRQLG
jgi:hypothetical protein